MQPLPDPWRLTQSYTALPSALYTLQQPSPVAQPSLLLFNETLAATLGLETLADDPEQTARWLSGNDLPPGSNPIAQAYAGHQFGYFTMLGDGRAILLGEQPDREGIPFDLQLKGAGRTPYSRNGDGRATLRAMLREYLMSEAMHGLGIPTSRSLAVVASGEPVYREGPQPGAVLTRVMRSHLRVGTLEYARRFRPLDEQRALLQYALHRHYPELESHPEPAAAFLEAVMQRQITLVVDWMRVGFIHGVMNTDNTAISGETFDYGPCAFLNRYDPDTVFSSIDHAGRYAFAQQPHVLLWNLYVLADALLGQLDATHEGAVERAKFILSQFEGRFSGAYDRMLMRKLGIAGEPDEQKLTLAADFLQLLREQNTDYSNSFTALRFLPDDENSGAIKTVFPDTIQLPADWTAQWKKTLTEQEGGFAKALELMTSSNPVYIARNHLVEQALDSGVNGDLSLFKELLSVLRQPYFRRPETFPTADPWFRVPAAFDAEYRTYCGT